MPSSLRLAIVSDPLVQRGGAERVVEAMAEAFPDAPIFAILYSAERGPAALAPRVRSSWLGTVPGARHRHRVLLPLFRSAVESFDLTGYDVILSSHHTAAKAVLRGDDQWHLCYCHTPMRALWERSHAEVGGLPAPARPLAAALFSHLRVWDYATAARVDRFVANSAVTQERIRKHYGRDSTILHPPIETERFTPGGTPEDYFLVASRPVPYKRIDIAVDAARLAGVRLKVVGGYVPSRAQLSERIEFMGHVDDARLIALMRGARALLFPQREDFGMTPVEMNACGRPVIAFAGGGALETVVDGETGVFVPEQSAEAFATALRAFDDRAFDPARLRAHAERFSKAAFADALKALVAERLSR